MTTDSVEYAPPSVAKYVSQNDICFSVGDPEEGRKKTYDESVKRESALKNRFDAATSSYRNRNFIGRRILDIVDIGESFGIDRNSIPVASGMYKIFKRNLISSQSERNISLFNAKMGNVYSQWVLVNYADNPNTHDLAFESFVAYATKNLTWEEYGAIGKDVDLHLTRLLVEQKDQILTNGVEIAQLRSEMTRDQAQAAKSLDSFKTEVQNSFDLVRAEFNKDLLNASKQSAADINLLADMAREANTERQRIVTTAERLADEVETNSKLIFKNAENIKANTQGVRQNAIDIQSLQEGLSQIDAEQRKTALLASDNAAKIDTIGAILFDSADAAGQVALVESGVYELDDEDAVASLYQKAESQKTLSQIDSATNVNNAFKNATVIASRLGMSDEDTKRAQDLSTVVDVGLSIARIYAGDITGVLGAVDGLTTLFGGAEEEPDPLQQQMAAYFAEVNAKLDELKEDVAEIDRKIEELQEWNLKAHSEVMDQLAILEGISRSNKSRLGYTLQILQSASNVDCRSLGGNIAKQYLETFSTNESYEELKSSYETLPVSKEIINCINSLTRPDPSSVYTGMGFLHDRDIDKVAESYQNWTEKLFSVGKKSVLFRDQDCRDSRLLDPNLVHLVGQTLLTIDPILYLDTTSSGPLNPRQISSQEHKQKHQEAIIRLSNWAQVIQCSLGQMSLTSGGLFYEEPVLNVLQGAISGYGTSSNERLLFSDQLLEGSYNYLHLNLSSRLIITEFGYNSAGLNVLDDYQNKCASGVSYKKIDLSKLNDKIKNQTFQFVLSKNNEQEGCRIFLELTKEFDVPSDKLEKVFLNIPLGKTIAVRRHINCHRFKPGLRETLLTSLIDIKRRLCGIASVDVGLSFV